MPQFIRAVTKLIPWSTGAGFQVIVTWLPV